jgi:hypothetical protein
MILGRWGIFAFLGVRGAKVVMGPGDDLMPLGRGDMHGDAHVL